MNQAFGRKPLHVSDVTVNALALTYNTVLRESSLRAMRRLPGYRFMGHKPGFMAFDCSAKCDDPRRLASGRAALWPHPRALLPPPPRPCLPLPLSCGSPQEGALEIELGGGWSREGKGFKLSPQAQERCGRAPRGSSFCTPERVL